MGPLLGNRYRRPGARATPGHRYLAVTGAALAALVAVTGCGASASDGSDAWPSSGARPGTLDAEDIPPPLDAGAPTRASRTGSADPGSGPTATRTERQSGDSSTGPAGAATRTRDATSRPGTRSFRTVGSTTDKSGDQGIEGPAYADVVAVSIADNGTTARVIVDMADDIPRQPKSGETIGIGVDLWRDLTRRESDYQLFAEGSEAGWFAHLDTPRGLVRYPGEFRLGGRRLVFEVPWQSLGDLRSGGFRTFADWSKRRVALNAASHDRAPEKSPARFRR